MKRITETQYLNSLDLCKAYLEQIVHETSGLFDNNKTLTCEQFCLKYGTDKIPATIFRYLYFKRKDVLLKDISDLEIIKLPNVSKTKYLRYKEIRGF